MNKPQYSLNSLYASHWESILRLTKANEKLSSPLLINVPENYFSQKLRLMIVGQQTQGWGDGTIEDLLTCYQEFNFGEAYYASPFWNVTRKIEQTIGIEPFNIVWSNLNKCDFDGGKPPTDLEERIFSCFPVLADEVKILNPDVLIFFSGPYFDDHIRRSFHECVFSTVNNFSENELCRIEHINLPHHSYRTYHPKYLRISRLESKVVEMFQKLNL